MPYREADDLNKYLFHEGTAISAYEYMGAHAVTHDGVDGYMFRVWAPRARAVSVVGDFNSWDAGAHPMAPPASSTPSTATGGATGPGGRAAAAPPSTPRR